MEGGEGGGVESSSSPVVLRRPRTEAPSSLVPELRDSTSHLATGSLGSPSKTRLTSVIASKNTRKRMEDRHVVLHDLKAYLPSTLQSKVSSEEHLSYYAVFDGHAGTDAASYAASNLHEMLVASPHYPEDPVQAFSDAFLRCDQEFTATSKKSGTTGVVALLRDSMIYLAWLGDSMATLVREGTTVKIMDSHKPDRPDERARIEGLGGTVIHWGAWRVNGQLAVSRAIGDGEYKPLVTAQPDVTTVQRNGTEDFIIVACDGLWDTVSSEEVTDLVYRHLRAHQASGGDLENLSAKLATVAKEKGSSDNITIVVVLLRPLQEIVCPPLCPDQVDGREAPHTHGITSTSAYVLGNPGSGRSSAEPAEQVEVSPSVKFDQGEGGVFSPAFGALGNGFDMSGEQFDTNLEDIRLSNGSHEDRVSGVDRLSNFATGGEAEEELKRQSIDKVDDLLAMLDREGGESPTGDEVDGLSLDEVLARAREQGGGDDCGEVVSSGESGDSSEEEDIVTEFPITNGHHDRLQEYEEGRRQPCEQVQVVATGPEECGMVVPPTIALPTHQTPEVMSVMSCSMVAEEPINGVEEEEAATTEQEGAVTFGEGGGEAAFMLKTPGEGEEALVRWERETSVDTGEEVEAQEVVQEEVESPEAAPEHQEQKEDGAAEAAEVPAAPEETAATAKEETEEPEAAAREPEAAIIPEIEVSVDGFQDIEEPPPPPGHQQAPLVLPHLQVTPATPDRRASGGEQEETEQEVTAAEVNKEETKTETKTKPTAAAKPKPAEARAGASRPVAAKTPATRPTTTKTKTTEAATKTKTTEAAPKASATKTTSAARPAGGARSGGAGGAVGRSGGAVAAPRSTGAGAAPRSTTGAGAMSAPRSAGAGGAGGGGGAAPRSSGAPSKSTSAPQGGARPKTTNTAARPTGPKPSTTSTKPTTAAARPTATTAPLPKATTAPIPKAPTTARPLPKPAATKPKPPAAAEAKTARPASAATATSRTSTASSASSLRARPASAAPARPAAPAAGARAGGGATATSTRPTTTKPTTSRTAVTKPTTTTASRPATSSSSSRPTSTTTSSSRPTSSTTSSSRPTSSTTSRPSSKPTSSTRVTSKPASAAAGSSAASSERATLRSPARPTAAATRVAAARAAAKAAKPPPGSKKASKEGTPAAGDTAPTAGEGTSAPAETTTEAAEAVAEAAEGAAATAVRGAEATEAPIESTVEGEKGAEQEEVAVQEVAEQEEVAVLTNGHSEVGGEEVGTSEC